ncbi:MAG: hypothetical protein JWL81_2958 [Verrucomicrobiales bacterium]|nr:hypothetical protein [Verrucomicrobiales bacterium]
MPALLSPASCLKRALVPLALLVPLVGTVVGFVLVNHRVRQDESRHFSTAVVIMRHQRLIHQMLTEWASRHDGKFPDIAGPAEATFNAVLPAGQFAKSAYLVSPPGSSTAYIAGLDDAADANTPILVTALTPTLAFLTGQTSTVPDPKNQGAIIITRIHGGAAQWTAAPLQPIVGGPGAPSISQVRVTNTPQE